MVSTGHWQRMLALALLPLPLALPLVLWLSRREQPNAWAGSGWGQGAEGSLGSQVWNRPCREDQQPPRSGVSAGRPRQWKWIFVPPHAWP